MFPTLINIHRSRALTTCLDDAISIWRFLRPTILASSFTILKGSNPAARRTFRSSRSLLKEETSVLSSKIGFTLFGMRFPVNIPNDDLRHWFFRHCIQIPYAGGRVFQTSDEVLLKLSLDGERYLNTTLLRADMIWRCIRSTIYCRVHQVRSTLQEDRTRLDSRRPAWP